MSKHKTPDAAPGAGNMLHFPKPPQTKREYAVDMRAQAREQQESSDMLDCIDVANRALHAAWHTKPGNRAKAWQRQAALLCTSGYSTDYTYIPRRPEPGAKTWGYWVHVFYWDPQEGESVLVRVWASAWRDAVEEALGIAIMI